MMNFVESSAGWIAARIQTIGAGFDPEVLSLPGGSIIAAFLWLYAGAALRMKRGVPRQAARGRTDPHGGLRRLSRAPLRGPRAASISVRMDFSRIEGSSCASPFSPLRS